MNKAWVVEFLNDAGDWIPFDIEWTEKDARIKRKERKEENFESEFRIRR